jgi:hypothetical protein
MYFNPTTTTSMEDWICEVVPRDPKRQPFTVAFSYHLTESQANECLMRLLQWRRVGLCDIRIKRRKQREYGRKPADVRVQKRYVDL